METFILEPSMNISAHFADFWIGVKTNNQIVNIYGEHQEE